MTYSCFTKNFSPSVSFLEYCGVCSAIKCAFKSLKLTLPDSKNSEKMLAKLNSINKPSQFANKIFINKKCTCPEKSQAKWIRDCESEDVENLDWRSIYLLPRKCTLSVKLRNFQFKFIHRRIATNSFLFKIKVSDTDLCCFCQKAKETLIHLFCDCPVTNAFWKNVQYSLFSVNLTQGSDVLKKLECLGLTGEKGEIIVNHCLLPARYYFFSCKHKDSKPSILEHIYQVKSNLKIEKQFQLPQERRKILNRSGIKYLSHCDYLNDFSFDFYYSFF